MIHVFRLFLFVIVAEVLVLCEENANEKNLESLNDIEHPQNSKDFENYLYKISTATAKNESWPTRTSAIKYNPYASLSQHRYVLHHKPVKFIGNIIRAPSKTISEKVIESPVVAIRDNSRIVGIQPTSSPSVGSPEFPPKLCPKCTCGKTIKNTRIIGGIETQVNGYPWMTALLYSNRFYCGGSLINNKYVLTAAHCVNGFSREKITAVFLDHDRTSSWETTTILRKIKNIYRHRGYMSGGSFNNDIALLQLEQEVPLTGVLKPVCLPPTGKSFTGHEGIATGWGATKEHGQVSNKLQEVRVPIMSNVDCKKTGYKNRITDNMLCAGYAKGQKDSCQGDSGGPLHVANGSIYQVVGVVSWGEGCAQPNYPGVYTRVNRYISWIKSNTKDACYC